MNSFDLRCVHDLIVFKDMYTTANDYMKEASCISHVDLETEPLYEVKSHTSVLFTPKLRYYRLLLHREVNVHINAAIKLIELDGTEQMTKYILKKTREAVTTLLNDAKRLLATLDLDGQAWNNITSESLIVSNTEMLTIEYVVFLHYLMAELVRCWLELQDRYAYVIGKAACYDVSLFYTANLNRMPDKTFEVKRAEKYEDEAKGFKKSRTDCCFLYDNDEFFAIAMQEFTNKLRMHKLIPDDIDYKYMESLFSGKPCRRKYTWLGNKDILTHIIKGLCDDENPIVTTWPKGTSKWDVVSCRFVDKDGNPMPNIRTEKIREKTKTVVNEAVKTLAGYL